VILSFNIYCDQDVPLKAFLISFAKSLFKFGVVLSFLANAGSMPWGVVPVITDN
jgi:hypothetical protein